MTDRELVALSRWTGAPDQDHVYKTLVVEAGGLERRLELGPAPTADSSCLATDSSHSGQAEFADTSHSAAEHADWVRIIQTDRHRAWSSPVYVTGSDECRRRFKRREDEARGPTIRKRLPRARPSDRRASDR